MLTILLPLLSTLPDPTSTARAASTVFVGLSSYPTSTSEIDNIIDTMDSEGLNIFRMSFNPEWFSSKPHPYQSTYVQYFLDHCNYYIIVDRNHIYPPTESGASKARSEWSTVKESVFEVLESWPNNSRVMVELVNEYVSRDFYSRMQSLVNDIRDAGYTNPIVANKWSQSWRFIEDPLNSVYQGYHYYFNSWSVSSAVSQVRSALSKGIKLINTEIGADYNEARYFSSTEVNELNSFVSQCANLGVGNAVWMNENLDNWSRYKSLGIEFPTVSTQDPPTEPPAEPPTEPPTSTTIYSDDFESNSLSGWSSQTRTTGGSLKSANYVPYSGNYHVRFYTDGGSSTQENAYLSKQVNLQKASVRGQIYFSSYLSTTLLSDNADRVYLIRLSTSYGTIASAGIVRENGVNKWVLNSNGGQTTSSAVSITTERYFDVALNWNPSTDIAELYVNGTRLMSRTNTSNADIVRVDMGIISTYSVQGPLIVYGDNFSISD